MNKKKVLIIGPSPTNSKGGMATVIQEMLESKVLNNNFNLKIHESYRDGNVFYRLLFSIYAFIKFLFLYNEYDIFHIHMASYGSTFRKGLYINFLSKKNKKIILHIHGAEYLVFYNKLSKSKKQKVKNIWNKSHTIIVLSKKWKKEFQNIFKNLNILEVNNGINIDKLSSGISDVCINKYKFLLLGRLGKRKGAYDIIKATEHIYSKYPSLKIFMAGDGEVEKVKQVIEEKKLSNSVEIVGWTNFNKKLQLLKEVSTILLPSYNEGLPMTILEGMATGKMIIASSVGAIPEVIENGKNGILILPGDIENLAKAMEKVMKNENNFLESCSQNNINKAKEKYSTEVMHNKILEIYNS